MAQGIVGDLAERPGQLDAGGPAAHDDEGEPLALYRRVAFPLGRFEGEQHAPTDLERVGDRLEPGRVGGPLLVAEVGMPDAGGDDEAVVCHPAAVLEADATAGGIEVHGLAEQDLDVGLAAQERPQRLGDLGGRQRSGGDLVEQRREQVVVVAVDEGDAHGRVAQAAHGIEAREAPADDDEPGQAFRGDGQGRPTRQEGDPHGSRRG